MSQQYFDVEYLLKRAYDSFSIDKQKTKITPPILKKEDRKSYITNFQDVCRSINHDPDEVRIYLGKELQMETSFKENGCLKIDSTVKSVGQIENIIKNYINDYVKCKACNSCKTIIQKVGR